MPLTPRSLLLALSTNDRARQMFTRNGMPRSFVRRFVAGEAMPDAIAAAAALQTQKVQAALVLLGENVSTEREACDATDSFLRLMETMDAASLTSPYISVKLTALGLDVRETLAIDNLRRILSAASRHGGIFVCVDMEGSRYTQRTLDIVREAHQDFTNVGTVLQSALFRTEQDVHDLLRAGISVRLVKGAYAEPPTAAYPAKADVNAAYGRQMHALLLQSRHSAIATHDEDIIREAKRFARVNGVSNDAFEFQMLYGIRRDLQVSLAAEGYNVRAYVPFGHNWFPYFMRRLAERPANVGFILKALLKP